MTFKDNSIECVNFQNHVEGVSVEVCNIMTRLGYGEEMRRRRIKKYSDHDMNMSERPGSMIPITVGSKGEGLTFNLESDRDFLCVLKHVLCVEAGVVLHTIPDDIEVYRMDTRVYPGHCIMLLERPASTRTDVIYYALCDDGKGNAVLSSAVLLHELSKLEFSEGLSAERAGLSIPRTIIGGGKIDMVLAVRCQCPDILQRWAQRSRLWPPPDIVQKVVSFGSFFVPTGFKGSDTRNLEWRICFNTGEKELVNNLYVTLTKLYTILKMILKEVLKPNNKEITSFVLKNVIFWQAENNVPSIFHERNLIHWLHDTLGTLRTVIACTQLPYYTIPERNLMAAC
ncbi:hypothetical protein DPMN_192623 [Dreissena polymorpha]|uniref:Uncharacterized protein n=1 Tax=Dreissena polymorpha TaxID=45954 RepID=A0A9D3Y7G4_DREPO|nr:hypothetical protein DPMN_192623 [Dreissena polymorpha]